MCVHVRDLPMPPIRHPCHGRIRRFCPRPSPELHAWIAGDLSRWQRRCSALGEACVRQQIRAGVLSKPGCHRSQRVDCYSSLTGGQRTIMLQKILGGPRADAERCGMPLALPLLFVGALTHTACSRCVWSCFLSNTCIDSPALCSINLCVCVCVRQWCASMQSLTAHSQEIRRVSCCA